MSLPATTLTANKRQHRPSSGVLGGGAGASKGIASLRVVWYSGAELNELISLDPLGAGPAVSYQKDVCSEGFLW